MTAVTRAADAPRAASAISSSSTRFSCTGFTSGWIRNTSRSRQLDCSWTSRQSFANRLTSTGRCGTARCAQISAVSAGCEVPPNTAISRTGGSPALPLARPTRLARLARLVRRQREVLPDLLLDDLGDLPRVHREDVLLAAEDLQHGVGLLVVLPQPDRQRLLGVVLPGDQLPAARIALARDLGAAVDEVVVHPAVPAQPAVEHAPPDLGVG